MRKKLNSDNYGYGSRHLPLRFEPGIIVWNSKYTRLPRLQQASVCTCNGALKIMRLQYKILIIAGSYTGLLNIDLNK